MSGSTEGRTAGEFGLLMGIWIALLFIMCSAINAAFSLNRIAAAQDRVRPLSVSK